MFIWIFAKYELDVCRESGSQCEALTLPADTSCLFFMFIFIFQD